MDKFLQQNKYYHKILKNPISHIKYDKMNDTSQNYKLSKLF